MSSGIIKFIKKLFLKYKQTLTDFVDFIIFLSSRDTKSQDSYNTIRLSLRAVCKKAMISRVSGGAALLLSACLFIIMVGAIGIYALLWFPYGIFIFYMGSLFILSFVFLRVLLLPLLSLFSKEKIALLIEERYPSLNNTLISSIQLTRDTSRKNAVKYSGQMISLLVDNTANQLRSLDINRVISKGFPRFCYAVLIVSALAFGTMYVFNRSYLNKNIPLLFSYLGSGRDIDEKGPVVYSCPVIGDITIVYRYPLYSELQSKTLYNTSGEIKALKGSEVQISATSDRPVASAGIVVNDSTRIPLVIENGKTMRGTLSLFESGTYVFETTDSTGRIFKDTASHTIQLESDQYPEVSISSPGKDITVNEKDTVDIRYTAKDDFGIDEITLVFEQENERKPKTLNSFRRKQNQYSGAYVWSLSELGLRPDDKIAYHVEVKDNDTISGPKVSNSKIYYLEIYSSKKKHQELIQLQEALLQEMLHMLSDDLTKRVDDEKCSSKDYLAMIQEGIQEQARKIIGLFTEVLVRMQDDTMANYSVYYSLENLKNKFRNVTDKKQTAIFQSIREVVENQMPVSLLKELQKVQDEEVAEVEQGILFLNEMIEKQKLEDVVDTGKNLIQSQNNIEKLLDTLRKGEDAKLNEKVLSELKRIEETIQQMMEKLMKMAQGEHMDEFFNADALKKIEQNDLMKEMDAMKDAFNKGDLNAALQAAQKLLSSIQEMMNQMKSSAQNFADSSYNDMLKETSQLSDKISELESKERELTENTDTLKKDIQKRASESMNETFPSFFEKQEKRLGMIKKDLMETKDILAKNTLLQEYLRVNRDLKRMSEERDAMASRLSELFGSDDDIDQFQEESEKLSELFGQNAELNREINKDPLLRNFLSLSRELPQTDETISHLEEMLKGWDAKESLNLAKELSQNLNQWNNRTQNILRQKVTQKEDIPKKDLEVSQKVNDAANLNQQIVNDLESMIQTLEEQQLSGLTEEDQNTLEKYAREQQELQEETEELREKADKLSQQNPFMDENADKQLDMASKSMGQAKEKLEKHDAQGSVIDERESLYRLAEAKKGMEMAKERISKGMMGAGLPMPMPRPFRGRMEEGQFGASTEKVEIPSEEAYKVPKEFRQDILDALKEGLPEKYKDLNRDYYQRLVD
ncbi:MAG: hypothetical protein DWB56_15960 [Candidatus Jettenia sp.]|uniref:Uncharacterized protein n=1 Tax=Candidatus Jettenia caeni TaxID=247490 RepID=I3IPL4_9BACT|nr:DUF4175 family protein [Candidatus Jettenia sp. AMX1]MBC6930420.1 hypothetical protein [Candidatus Jettenia sp.]WKZ16108.1 MAG: hypothetical protein QY317_02145 [Candidatus Jettenia caeni]KAA0247358.1 MAG: hypothetical protein EDM77_15295 [Candidatus Jettenia sp. AMX1]MCE7882104.1 hypothetical protein [Candidatus Jettenia sp. AMX1]MCQ3928729.1 hypothetical protein [Candidatus Jettenia sp.]